MRQILMECLNVFIVVLLKQAAQYAWGKDTPQSCVAVWIGIPSDDFNSSL